MKNLFLAISFVLFTFLSVNSLSATTATSACTREYAPVCGQPPMPTCPPGMACIQVMPQVVTYSNSCVMLNSGATLVRQGTCEGTTGEGLVGGDVDEYGCKASAGYSYDSMMEMCVRPWEKSQNLVTWAYTEKLTQYSTVEAFGFDRNISRQEAAAILARAGETLLELRYASYPDECNVLYKDEALFDLTLSKDIYSACAFDMMHGKDGYFSPFNSLTRAEALAVIMRAIDGGKKDEPNSTSWYLPYADRAHELDIFSFANFKGFNEAITRGELIEWLYRANLYIKKGVSMDNRALIGNWTLTQFNTTTVANPSYTLKFETDAISTKFCNSLFGSYSLSGSTFSAPALASTMMYCEGMPMTLEDAFALDGASYSLKEIQTSTGITNSTLELTIITKKGDTFSYVR